MQTVQEELTTLASDAPVRTVRRHEDLLLGQPLPGPMKLWRDQAPLEVVHFPPVFVPAQFSPPRGVYESGHLRVEWQMMDNRQPFYHRNCDVDELSYQVVGERTLMTDLGTVEHVPGDFSRIPRGVVHDNYGRKETHLLFYVPAPVVEQQPAALLSETRFPPFPGWEPATINEIFTDSLGSLGSDVTIFPSDEQQLLEQARDEQDRLQVLRPDPAVEGSVLLYRGDGFRLSAVRVPPGDGRVYRRRLDAHEVQYQISGRRTLVTERGVLDLEPGDFVRIPLGVAASSISTAECRYVSLLSAWDVPQVAPATRHARPPVVAELDALRRSRPTSGSEGNATR